jgi:hypothetical protein
MGALQIVCVPDIGCGVGMNGWREAVRLMNEDKEKHVVAVLDW